jgi:hypothetical protein
MSVRPGTLEILMDAAEECKKWFGHDEDLYRMRHELPDRAYPMVATRMVHDHFIFIIHKDTLREQKEKILTIISKHGEDA